MTYTYSEPIRGEQFSFALLPRTSLRASPYQREYSSTLANRLVNTIASGFVVPVIVTAEGDHYLVIDGQHRLGGLDKVSSEDDPLVPCIILPSHYKDFPLFYNIEKTDNIKDKSQKVHRVYLDKLQVSGLTERDLMPSVNFEPYIFTIAFSYMENGLSSPSLVESPVKKVDNYELTMKDENGWTVGMPLVDAVEVRRRRAALAKELEDTVGEVARDNGISDFNLKRAIVSQSSQALWGRKRKIDEEPEEALETLIEQIQHSDWSMFGGR